MNIAILNYAVCSVDFWDNIPNTLDTDEQIREYLTDELGYRLDDIYYMVGDEITCYYNDNEEPFNILR